MLATCFAHSEEPFAFERAPGKLPKEAIPKHYRIQIAPDIAARTVHGSENITLQLQKPLSSLTLNAVGLRVLRASIRSKDAAQHTLTVSANETLQTITLTSTDEISAGAAELEIEWDGTLSEQPEGLFITRYQAGDTDKLALATQMEPADARRMFPCWDEPAFRAEFELSAIVPANHVAISNMPPVRESLLPGGKKKLDFGSTPPMASYLVAFCSGEFEQIHDEVDGIRLSMITTEGKIEQARFALEATKQILRFYNDYFGVRYPLPKLDQFCFPGFPAGGMENWGAIFYTDRTLLYDPERSPESVREHIFATVAHELAHQWFGDLVTMGWWDNLWLNEGFASWMGTKATDHFHPEWKVWLSAADSKERAMNLDARATTHPIQRPVHDEHEASESFDEITYSKGQSFLRMLESYLGEEAFRDGIRRYIAGHTYGNTTTADLWSALGAASGKDIRKMAAEWTEQPGFPLVTINSDGNTGSTLRFAQERFTIHQANPAPLTWQIPVTIFPLGSPENTSLHLLGADGITIDLPNGSLPVKVNAGGVGYFRNFYDESQFRKLCEQSPTLPDADRLNLVQDTWALVEAGRLPASAFLNLVARIAPTEENYVVWSRMISILVSVDHLERLNPGRSAFRNWACALLRPQMERLGWSRRAGDTDLDQRLRITIIRSLAEWGDPSAVAKARAMYERFLIDPATLPADLHAPVLSIAGRDADAARYEQLHSLARAEQSTELKVQLYDALATSRDPVLARKTLQIALTDELPSTLASALVQRVATLGEQPELAWDFTRANLAALQAKVSSLGADHYVPNLLRNFTDANRADELEAFARTNLPPQAGPSVAKASDEIRFKSEFKQRLLPEFANWIEAAALKAQR